MEHSGTCSTHYILLLQTQTNNTNIFIRLLYLSETQNVTVIVEFLISRIFNNGIIIVMNYLIANILEILLLLYTVFGEIIASLTRILSIWPYATVLSGFGIVTLHFYTYFTIIGLGRNNLDVMYGIVFQIIIFPLSISQIEYGVWHKCYFKCNCRMHTYYFKILIFNTNNKNMLQVNLILYTNYFFYLCSNYKHSYLVLIK